MNALILVLIYSLSAYAQFNIKGLENLDNPFKKGNPMCNIDLAYKEGRNEAADSHRYTPAPSRMLAVGHGCKPEVVEKMKAAFVKGAKDAETMGKVDESVQITLDDDTKKSVEKYLPTAGAKTVLTPKKKPAHGCLKGSNGILCGWNCAKASDSQTVFCSKIRDHFCFADKMSGACGKNCTSSKLDGIRCSN